MDKTERKLTDADIKAIESVLKADDRVEVVPVKDGVKILHIVREEVKRNK